MAKEQTHTHDSSLREQIPHGTVYQPFQVMHFPMPENLQFRVMGHWHEEIEVLYIRRGNYILERNMQAERLPEGSVCFVSSEELHDLAAEAVGSSHSVVLFHPEILGFEWMDEGQSQVIRPLLAGQRKLPGVLTPEADCYRSVRELLEDIFRLWEEQRTGWYLRCKVDMLQIIALLAEAELLTEPLADPPGEERVQQMKHLLSWLEAHYQEKVTLADLAEEMDRNSQYLCRYFKETMGMTIMEYLNRYRIEQAAAMLEETDKKVLDISLDCGYENFSYFIRRFREYKGMTPVAYRRMVRR